MSAERSRPLALAATLIGEDAPAIEDLFTTRRVLLCLEREAAASAPLREGFLLAVNEILRYCTNVAVALPPDCDETASAAVALAREIHGSGARIDLLALAETDEQVYDAVLNVGRELHEHPAWIAIDGSGWTARVATAESGLEILPPSSAPPNVFAALAAASLGAGQVFLALVGRPLLARPLAFSLWSLETGSPAEVPDGPPLPEGIELQSLLVGCGGVAHGFAYAAARSPLRGELEAVDKQSLRPENLGAYVCATRSRLGEAKAEVIRDVLAPAIEVRPRNERLHFFKARIGHGQTRVPKIVIVGLDDERVRHEVQRLQAPVTIDMAAEELTAQLIVKDVADDGVCLIGAYRVDESAPGELEQLAKALGLPVERVGDFESTITAEDVATAPPEKRAMLEEARRRGQRICGRATELDLHEEDGSGAFTPAVPFVTAFTGIAAAAQLTRQLMGAGEGSLHFQFSFLTYRSREMRMRCPADCECARAKPITA